MQRQKPNFTTPTTTPATHSPIPTPANDPPTGPITEIQTTLTAHHVAKYADFLVIALGLFVTVLGIVTLVLPIALAGSVVLLLGIFYYIWFIAMRNFHDHHRHHPRTF